MLTLLGPCGSRLLLSCLTNQRTGMHCDPALLQQRIDQLCSDRAWGNGVGAYLAARVLGIPLMIMEPDKSEGFIFMPTHGLQEDVPLADVPNAPCRSYGWSIDIFTPAQELFSARQLAGNSDSIQICGLPR
eukprot:2235373-Amphidinium_carterae.1